MNTLSILLNRTSLFMGLKALAPLAGKANQGRPHIEGIHLAIDQNANVIMTATDGHCAGRLTLATVCGDGTDGHGAGFTSNGVLGWSDTLSVILPPDTVKGLLQSSDLKSRSGSEHVLLKINGSTVTVTFGKVTLCAGDDLDWGNPIDATPNRVTLPVNTTDVFPPIAAVWGESKISADGAPFDLTATLAPRLFMRCIKAFDVLGAEAVQFHQQPGATKLDPVHMSAWLGAGRYGSPGLISLQICAMPIRADKRAPWGIVPTWGVKAA